MPKISLKEGWISLDIVYSHGGERWLFHQEEPSHVEDVYTADRQFVPGKLIRILYCEADGVEIQGERDD